MKINNNAGIICLVFVQAFLILGNACAQPQIDTLSPEIKVNGEVLKNSFALLQNNKADLLAVLDEIKQRDVEDQGFSIVWLKGGEYGGLVSDTRKQIIEKLQESFLVKSIGIKFFSEMDILYNWRDIISEMFSPERLTRSVNMRDFRIRRRYDELVSLLQSKHGLKKFADWRSKWEAEDIIGDITMKELRFFLWYHRQPMEGLVLSPRPGVTINDLAERFSGREYMVKSFFEKRNLQGNKRDYQSYVKAVVVNSLRRGHFFGEDEFNAWEYADRRDKLINIARQMLGTNDEVYLKAFVFKIGWGIHGKDDYNGLREDLEYLSADDLKVVGKFLADLEINKLVEYSI
ncbi:MAG: hypothetical protein ABII88_09510 [Candidatus Omnitrophota bacterium]